MTLFTRTVFLDDMSLLPKLDPGMWLQRHGHIERRTILAILKRDQSSSDSLDRTHRNVGATLATFGLSAMAASGRPEELEPAKAIASIPIARIEPRIVLALSHLLNSRSSFGVIL